MIGNTIGDWVITPAGLIAHLTEKDIARDRGVITFADGSVQSVSGEYIREHCRRFATETEAWAALGKRPPEKARPRATVRQAHDGWYSACCEDEATSVMQRNAYRTPTMNGAVEGLDRMCGHRHDWDSSEVLPAKPGACAPSSTEHASKGKVLATGEHRWTCTYSPSAKLAVARCEETLTFVSDSTERGALVGLDQACRGGLHVHPKDRKAAAPAPTVMADGKDWFALEDGRIARRADVPARHRGAPAMTPAESARIVRAARNLRNRTRNLCVSSRESDDETAEAWKALDAALNDADDRAAEEATRFGS